MGEVCWHILHMGYWRKKLLVLFLGLIREVAGRQDLAYLIIG